MTGGERELRSLVLLEQARPTGLVRQLIELLARLPERGVRPRLVCVLREGVDERPLVDQLTSHGIAYDIVRESRAADVRSLWRIRRILKRHEPDVLQTHGYKTAAAALLLGAGRGRTLPWIAFYHGRTTTDWKVRLYHRFERWALHRADVIAPVSPGVESHFRASDRARLTPVPNGVIPLAAATASRDEIRQRYGFTQEEVVVAFVGRLSHEKAPDRFLRALEAALTARPTLVGFVVGDGPMRPELAATASRMRPRIVFAGTVDGMREVYDAVDAVMIPSRSEVFPNVLLEAVDAGVPVAATPVGGIPTIARGLPSVVVAPDGSPSRLAGALHEALDTTDADRLTSRDTVRERYGQSKRAEQFASLVHVLVRGRA